MVLHTAGAMKHMMDSSRVDSLSIPDTSLHFY